MDKTIILLHGLGAHPYTMSMLKFGIGDGYKRTIYISYPTQVNLEEAIKHVKKEIASQITPKEKLIFIGQSMGGVIAYKIHRDYNTNLIITIGSPLHGSRFLKMLDDNLPSVLSKCFRKPMYDDLIHMTKQRELKAYGDLKEPNCSYHCITMSWPCLSFDGCVHVDEAIISKKHHTHLKIADHRTIFANPRLVYHVNQILNKESEV